MFSYDMVDGTTDCDKFNNVNAAATTAIGSLFYRLSNGDYNIDAGSL